MIIAVDFDGTLSLSTYPEVGVPNERVVAYIKEQKANGAEIILNTMREGEPLERAVEWCRGIGIEFDAVNDNLPRMKNFFGNNPRNIYANVYIDDCNISFRDIPVASETWWGVTKCGSREGDIYYEEYQSECGTCGYDISDGDNYCPSCGTKIRWND
ncbi:hypothetical protein FACS189499_03740 [Clostridia bacterium]|nr:hypothetical protein FACS189499_03740 [Clostridia bacterium]